MSKYVIDGKFLTEQITGIQRYALEITRALDTLLDSEMNIEILLPNQYKNEEFQYKNIKVVFYGEYLGDKWEQIDLPRYLKKNKAQGIFLCNVVPIFYPQGIACIHDVSYKVNPDFFVNRHGRLSRMWHKMQYKVIAKNFKKIITVSEFSKKEIVKWYHVNPNNITVVGNSWEHFTRELPDETEFEQFPMLEKRHYYFSMASLAPNKNLKWILEAAKENPEEIFAIAGMLNKERLGQDFHIGDLKNVIYLGYVTDAQAKILMKNCKAFLFPTLYEGFGIPPLEAIACGTPQIIVSNTECMREVYGKYANYINLENKTYKLEFEDKKNNSITDVLDKYSWTKSAEKLRKLL